MTKKDYLSLTEEQRMNFLYSPEFCKCGNEFEHVSGLYPYTINNVKVCIECYNKKVK